MFRITNSALMDRNYPNALAYIKIEAMIWVKQKLWAVKIWAKMISKQPSSFHLFAPEIPQRRYDGLTVTTCTTAHKLQGASTICFTNLNFLVRNKRSFRSFSVQLSNFIIKMMIKLLTYDLNTLKYWHFVWILSKLRSDIWKVGIIF